MTKRSPGRAALQCCVRVLLNRELEDGGISLEEFEREEERLLDRLHVAQTCSTSKDRR
nr:gas vesicle protein GvpG [Streptomyces rhizosphaerihabitans]